MTGCAMYRHFDKAGGLLYVGISLNHIARLVAHRHVSGWYSEIRTITVEYFETEREAAAAEILAIANEKPAHNHQHNGQPILGENGLFSALSSREIEILELLNHGKRGSEIAAELHLSPKTVSTYRSRLAEKMDLKGPTDVAIVTRARRLGLCKAGTDGGRP